MHKPRGDVEISSSFTYKIPHLQSQFPPNPTPNQPKGSTPATYKSIHTTDIPPNLA